MNNLQVAFLEALESGAYKQGFGALRHDGCHCAMGVAGDVLVKQGLAEWHGSEYGVFAVPGSDPNGFIAYLPRELLVQMGLCQTYFTEPGSFLHRKGVLRKELMQAVLMWNDSEKVSFEHIAVRLRKVWTLDDQLTALQELRWLSSACLNGEAFMEPADVLQGMVIDPTIRDALQNRISTALSPHGSVARLTDALKVSPELGVWVAQNPDATPADFLREAVKQLNAFHDKEKP